MMKHMGQLLLVLFVVTTTGFSQESEGDAALAGPTITAGEQAPTAQDQRYSFYQQYEKNTLYFQNRFFGGAKYVENGVEYSVGFLNFDLYSKLMRSEAAGALAAESKQDMIMSLVGLGGAIASIALMGSEQTAGMGLLVYFGSLGFSIVKQYASINKLHEAVWIYNREQTFKMP